MGIAIEESRFDSRQGQCTTSRPALGPTESAVRSVPGTKRQERETHQASPCSARPSMVELYLHSPIRPYELVLNKLSSWITLPLPLNLVLIGVVYSWGMQRALPLLWFKFGSSSSTANLKCAISVVDCFLAWLETFSPPNWEYGLDVSQACVPPLPVTEIILSFYPFKILF
jgi:hypothetical protein